MFQLMQGYIIVGVVNVSIRHINYQLTLTTIERYLNLVPHACNQGLQIVYNKVEVITVTILLLQTMELLIGRWEDEVLNYTLIDIVQQHPILIFERR